MKEEKMEKKEKAPNKKPSLFIVTVKSGQMKHASIISLVSRVE